MTPANRVQPVNSSNRANPSHKVNPHAYISDSENGLDVSSTTVLSAALYSSHISNSSRTVAAYLQIMVANVNELRYNITKEAILHGKDRKS